MITKTVKGFRVTTEYGVIDSLHKVPHTGIDIVVPEGSPLYSVGHGIVENIVNYGSNNIGKGVIVKLDSGQRVIYGHLSQVKVEIGDKVELGDLVALSGNTGRSTGEHLHLGLKDGNEFIDPSKIAETVITGNKAGFFNFDNPFHKVNNTMTELNDKLDTFMYWINPKNLIIEGWEGLDHLVNSPETAVWVMGGTVICVWLMMLGLKVPKNYIFWGWIIFWVLRGFVFA